MSNESLRKEILTKRLSEITEAVDLVLSLGVSIDMIYHRNLRALYDYAVELWRDDHPAFDKEPTLSEMEEIYEVMVYGS